MIPWTIRRVLSSRSSLSRCLYYFPSFAKNIYFWRHHCFVFLRIYYSHRTVWTKKTLHNFDFFSWSTARKNQYRARRSKCVPQCSGGIYYYPSSSALGKSVSDIRNRACFVSSLCTVVKKYSKLPSSNNIVVLNIITADKKSTGSMKK